jgi:hypothetical protein
LNRFWLSGETKNGEQTVRRFTEKFGLDVFKNNSLSQLLAYKDLYVSDDEQDRN